MKKIIIVLLILVFVVSCSSSENKRTLIVVSGKVVEKVHTLNSQRSDLGYIFTGDGLKLGIVNSGSPERWDIFVSAGGEILQYKVEPELYYTLEVNDEVGLSCVDGVISSWCELLVDKE